MKIPLMLAFLFFVGSTIGWVIELVFRRFFSSNNPERKWINPGFLVGPCIPLYGFSLCILFVLASLESSLQIENAALRKLLLFAVMALCVTALEYIVGLISLKYMKVRLWDYSNNWGNIQGIICPKFSFFWVLLSAAYYFLVHPRILTALDWLSRNLAFSFGLGFFFGVFVVDFVYSSHILVKIRSFARENDIIVRLEELREDIRKNRADRREKTRFFVSMLNGAPLLEQLREYKDFRSDIRREKREFRDEMSREVNNLMDDVVDDIKAHVNKRDD